MASGSTIVDHLIGIQVNGTASPRLVGHNLLEVVLNGIVFGESSSGEATANRCGQTLSGGIQVTDGSTAVVGANDCTIARIT